MPYIYRSNVLYAHICFAYTVRLPHMSSYSAIYVLTLAYMEHLHHIYVHMRSYFVSYMCKKLVTYMAFDMYGAYNVSTICGIYVKCHYVSYIVRLYVHVCVHLCANYEWHIWHLTYMVHICQCYMWHICQLSLCFLYCAFIRACIRAYMCKIWVTYMTFDIHGTYMSILYM